MRILVVQKDSNVKALLAGASAEQLQVLQRYNPHLDLRKLAPGAVIVVPDGAGDTPLPKGDTKSIGAEAMASFMAFAEEALAASARRMQQAAERAKSEDAALASALKSRTVLAAFEKDAEMKAQAETAAKQAKDDVKASAEAIRSFETLSKTALNELSVLAKMLG
jgi:hypothetical protein